MPKPRFHSQSGLGMVLLLIVVVLVAAVASIVFAMQTNRIQLSSLSLPFVGSSSQTATLTGTVRVGPTSPVCISGQPCSRAAASYTLEVRDANGTLVASTKTDASGAYTLHLLPGTYVLLPVPKIGVGASSRQVTVKAGTNHVDIEFDTGLR